MTRRYWFKSSYRPKSSLCFFHILGYFELFFNKKNAVLTLLFSFREEGLLTLYILIGILCCSFQQRGGAQNSVAKRNFFLFFRFTFFVAFVCLGLAAWSILTYDPLVDPVVDVLVINDFYNTALADLYGNAFFRKDYLVLFYNLILTFLVLFFLFLVFEYTRFTTNYTKYYLEIPILIMTTFLGLKVLIFAYDLILIVLALELTAFCSIILMSLQISTTSQNTYPFEAALKYFIFNAVAISLFLFAISGYYSIFKSLNLFHYTFYFLFEPAFCYENMETILFFHGFFFIAYLMKIGAAPFHQWVPDVYEGSELLITAFLVLLIGPLLNFKFFVFLKVLLPLFDHNSVLLLLLIICGFISVIIGSFNAFTQFRIKRFLAYTGITHLGYILISLGTATILGLFSGLFYLIFYILTNCAFFSILLLSKRLSSINLIFFNQLKSVLTDNILLVFFFLVPILSFAGFPPMGGFFSKFFMLLAILDLNKIILTLMLVFYVLLSAYLYLRFIKIALFESVGYSYYFPLNLHKQTQYYKISNMYRLTRTAFNINNTLLFVLFIINSLLLVTLAFLPTIGLGLQKPILTLLLFF